MSDKMRWRYGDTNPVVAAVDAETVIEIGDLVWQDVDNVKPAPQVPCTLNLSRTEFVKRFLGVAMQRSRAGDTAPIRVATTGVFEFDCQEPDTFELGDLIAPALAFVHGCGYRPRPQVVQRVGREDLAIGRAAMRAAESVRSVLVDIRSTVMRGGI